MSAESPPLLPLVLGLVPWSTLASGALAGAVKKANLGCRVIVPRTLEQVNGSLRALEINLDTETLKNIDGILPPVGINLTESKPAPEPYAW